MSSQVPFGLRHKDGQLVADPAEASTVRMIAEAFLTTGGRLKSAASLVNKNGLTTRRGGLWRDVTIARVIKTVSEDVGIVSDDLRLRCLALLQERSGPTGAPRRRPVHFLGATLFCNCGEKMRLFGRGPGGRFVCRSCRGKIPAEDLERVFLNAVSSVEVTAVEIRAAFAGNERITSLLGGLAETISISEVWPVLGPEERRLFVDVAVSRIVVDGERITVTFGLEADLSAETQAFSEQTLPSSYDSEELENSATHHGNVIAPLPIGSVHGRRDRRRSPRQQPLEAGSNSNGRGPTSSTTPGAQAYRIRQVAELLSLPRSTVYDLVRTGLLASVRTGSRGKGVVLIPAGAVTEFLEKRRRS